MDKDPPSVKDAKISANLSEVKSGQSGVNQLITYKIDVNNTSDDP